MRNLTRRDALKRGGATAIAGAAAITMFAATGSATPIANLYARFERLQRFWKRVTDDDICNRLCNLQSRIAEKIAALPAQNERDLCVKVRLLGEYATELLPYPNEPKLVAPKVYASLMRDADRFGPGGVS